MSDIAEGRIAPGVGNAMCNAGGKLLKVVELQYKFGAKAEGTSARVLRLAELASADEGPEGVDQETGEERVG